jgi:hypothetical protein
VVFSLIRWLESASLILVAWPWSDGGQVWYVELESGWIE